MKLLLVRHGHVEGLTPERFRGHSDVPLTDLGQRQIIATGLRIATGWKVDAIYTSPLGRCIETGAAIAEATGAPTTIAREFLDFDYGDWSWQELEAVRQAEPEAYSLWRSAPHLMRIPRGDSLQDMVARTADGLRRLMADHAGDTVVVVGHDSANRALLLQLLDMPLSRYWRLRQDPCCINEIDLDPPAISVVRINETAHLTS